MINIMVNLHLWHRLSINKAAFTLDLFFQLPSATFYMQPYEKRKKAAASFKKRPPFKNFKTSAEPDAFLSSVFSTFQKSAG